MIKIIKKKIIKGFLLFLFGLFSVGVQGQNPHRIDYNKVTPINIPPEQNEYGIVNPVYTLNLAAGLVNLPSNLTITVTMNMQIPNVSGGSGPSYSYTGDAGYNFPSTFMENILNTFMSSFGTTWGIGDSGSFYVESPSGGGGYTPPPCVISCPVGYILTPYCTCIKEPCNTDLKAKLNTFANNAIVKTQILAAQTAAQTEKFERSTVINKDATTLALTSPGLGAPGTANSVPISANSTTQSLLHSHPDNSLSMLYPSHSPADIYALYNAYTSFNNVKYSITVGITHAYMLVVENPAQLTSFILSNPEATSIIPKAADFKLGTDLAKVLNEATTALENQGESIDSAFASAFAYLLKFKRTGLVLYESVIASDGSTNFHSKNTSSTVIPAKPATATTPAVPETTTYTKIDCL